MKIVALVTIQACAFFLCHTTADTGPRPKRTLKLFENFMDTMRAAFGPEPPDLPPPEVIAKIATLPYSNPYTYFPTIRMHIRPMEPVEKHIVYVKALPPSPSAPMLFKPNMNDVEIIRMIQPYVRRPKSNSASIHYEIIPITIPIPEVPAPVNQSPLSGDREFENEEGAFSGIPWSMDALPPPVPTSKSYDSRDEHMVPWQLQALPPPVATKRPSWHPILKTQTSNNDGVFFPMKKKIMIPANSEKEARVNFFDDKFMPSPLHSEISVQPSLELTAFSETDSVTVPPISNFRVRRIFEKKSNTKSRPKRDAHANFPKHAESPLTKLGSGITPTVKSAVHINDGSNLDVPLSDAPSLSLAFDEKIFSKAFPSAEKSITSDERKKSANKYGHQDFRMKSKFSSRTSSNPPFSSKKLDTPTIFDFGEYSDNEEADREENKPALSEKHKRRMNFSDDSVSIVQSHDILSDYPKHHEYIPVVTRQRNFSHQLSDSSNRSKFPSTKSPSSLATTSSDDTKKQFNLRNSRISFNKQSDSSDLSEDRRPTSDNFDFSFLPKDPVKKAQRNYFSKQNSEDPYEDLFGERQSGKDVKGRQYFDKFWKSNFEQAPKYDFGRTEKSHDFGTLNKKSPQFDYEKPSHSDFEHHYDKISNGFENEKGNKQQNSTYDNIEYFEPVVIDIDSEEPSEDLFSKFRPKLKQKITSETEETYSNEPLRLPDSLHETVDFIKTKSAHPPTFDLTSEADEHSVIAMIDENKVGR